MKLQIVWILDKTSLLKARSQKLQSLLSDDSNAFSVDLIPLVLTMI